MEHFIHRRRKMRLIETLTGSTRLAEMGCKSAGCPPPPIESRREAEPVSALKRTSRRLSAAVAAASLLFALGLSLLPQPAQAQVSSIQLTANTGPDNGDITLSWTWTGSLPAGGYWQYSWSNLTAGGARTGTLKPPPSKISGLTNGQTYAVEVRAKRRDGTNIATSNRIHVIPNELILTATGQDSSILLRWEYHGSEITGSTRCLRGPAAANGGTFRILILPSV